MNFPDSDNFEPKLPTTLTSSNKWEGEDEEEIVKVSVSMPNSEALMQKIFAKAFRVVKCSNITSMLPTC